MIEAGIKEDSTIYIIELEILFHGKVSRASTQMTAINEDVKGIISLFKKNSSWRVGNFQTKKIFQCSKIFNFECLGKKRLELADNREMITCHKKIININKNKSKRCSTWKSEKRVVSMWMSKTSSKKNRGDLEKPITIGLFESVERFL